MIKNFTKQNKKVKVSGSVHPTDRRYADYCDPSHRRCSQWPEPCLSACMCMYVCMCRYVHVYVHVYECMCRYTHVYSKTTTLQGTNNTSQPSHETKTKVRTTKSSDGILQSTRQLALVVLTNCIVGNSASESHSLLELTTQRLSTRNRSERHQVR